MAGVQPTTAQCASPVWGLAVVESSISLGSRHLPVSPQNASSQSVTKRWHDWRDGVFQFIQTAVRHNSQLQWSERLSVSSFAKVSPLYTRLTWISPPKKFVQYIHYLTRFHLFTDFSCHMLLMDYSSGCVSISSYSRISLHSTREDETLLGHCGPFCCSSRYRLLCSKLKVRAQDRTRTLKLVWLQIKFIF